MNVYLSQRVKSTYCGSQNGRISRETGREMFAIRALNVTEVEEDVLDEVKESEDRISMWVRRRRMNARLHACNAPESDSQ